MLKRKIKYTDFNDQEVEEVVYFNLSKSEMIEMEVGYQKGFTEHIQGIINAKDNKSLLEEFKSIILKTYGVKSEDGKRFMKNDQLREEFSQTAAFEALFMELAGDEGAAVAFITAVVPKDIGSVVGNKMKQTTAEIAAAQAVQDKPTE